MIVARSAIVIALVIALIYAPRPALADPSPAEINAKPSASAEGGGAAGVEGTAAAPTIAPGTVINSSNWPQYKQYMSDGEIGLWEGKWFWKMPADAQINVGSTTVYALPTAYVAASEKYGDQTRIEKGADGRWRLKNYVAGVPFPIPTDPDKGQKI